MIGKPCQNVLLKWDQAKAVGRHERLKAWMLFDSTGTLKIARCANVWIPGIDP